MQFKDYYAVMGLARDATAAQVRQAYRKLARKYHPDVSKEPDAELKFKELGEAYEVLKDPQKRAAYDQLGSGPPPGQAFRPPPDWGESFEFRGAGHAGPGEQGRAAWEDDPSEFFEALFGRGGFADARTRQGGGRGGDHHARVRVDLEASLEGGTRALALRVPQVGADGHVRLVERALNVKIPRGIQSGQHIRLAGQGETLPGTARAGDLLLEVEFAPHPVYRAAGADLHRTLAVAPWEAALGTRLQLPVPGGTVELRIPAGSRSGTRLRLRGRGLPSRTPGDLYVTLEIALPPADSAAARAAYEAFAAALPFDPRSSGG